MALRLSLGDADHRDERARARARETPNRNVTAAFRGGCRENRSTKLWLIGRGTTVLDTAPVPVRGGTSLSTDTHSGAFVPPLRAQPIPTYFPDSLACLRHSGSPPAPLSRSRVEAQARRDVPATWNRQPRCPSSGAAYRSTSRTPVVDAAHLGSHVGRTRRRMSEEALHARRRHRIGHARGAAATARHRQGRQIGPGRIGHIRLRRRDASGH
jgi:hypothetical protein